MVLLFDKNLMGIAYNIVPYKWLADVLLSFGVEITFQGLLLVLRFRKGHRHLSWLNHRSLVGPVVVAKPLAEIGNWKLDETGTESTHFLDFKMDVLTYLQVLKIPTISRGPTLVSDFYALGSSDYN